MRLICHSCTKINRYTIWEIARSGYFSSKKLLCKHCGLDTINNIIVTKIAWTIIVSSILVINSLLLNEYKDVIPTSLVKFTVSVLFASALYFLMMPLYAFLICIANNWKYRIRQNRKKNL